MAHTFLERPGKLQQVDQSDIELLFAAIWR